MPWMFDFGLEAPLLETEDAAGQTDSYLFVPYDLPEDYSSILSGGSVGGLSLEEEVAANEPARDFSLKDVEDSLVLVLGLSTDGSAVPDSSTPAQPKGPTPEPVPGGWEDDLSRIGTARHSVTGAMLQRMLVYGD